MTAETGTCDTRRGKEEAEEEGGRAREPVELGELAASKLTPLALKKYGHELAAVVEGLVLDLGHNRARAGLTATAGGHAFPSDLARAVRAHAATLDDEPTDPLEQARALGRARADWLRRGLVDEHDVRDELTDAYPNRPDLVEAAMTEAVRGAAA